jgi:nitrite reductase/ring-hydroxylating ferredoxin subunit
MADWPDRLNRFVEALRDNRRPERVLAATPEEIDDLRLAGMLAGLRDEFADPDPRFLARLRAQVGVTEDRPPTRIRRSHLLRTAGVLAAGLVAGLGLDRVWLRLQGSATPTGSRPALPAMRWYPVANLADLTDGAATPVQAGAIPAFVIRQGDSARALSRVCTHMGCLLSFAAKESELQCPCHGAVFDLQGYPDPEYLKMSVPPLPVLDARVVRGTVYVLGV